MINEIEILEDTDCFSVDTWLVGQQENPFAALFQKPERKIDYLIKKGFERHTYVIYGNSTFKLEPSVHVKLDSASISYVEEKFHRLASEWKKETAHLSSVTDIVLHPKYQNIIGMGETVLPFLFKEMQREPDHWFWALRSITEANPTKPEDAGNLRKLTESWLNWAKNKSYL